MKNVLIPIDFSENSINALNYAEAFFKNKPINFYLLGVYISSPSKLMSDDYNEDWLGKMDDTISEDLKNLAEHYNNSSDLKHNYKAVTMADSLTRAMKSVINDKEIDLVISGTKGASGLKEIFIGSNTLKMINHIDNCPVLVVPNGYKFQGLHQIVFSTNYKRSFKSNELKPLIQIAVIHNALIEVVQLVSEDFLSETQRKNKTDLQGFMEDFEFDFNKLDWEGSETETIQNHIENCKSELLTLINHKYNFFNKLTEEDVIKKSSFHSKIPLLVLPEL